MARIQHNITAMNTHRMYTNNNNAVAKNAEKLASGYRINRAGDDAAGLAISEKMRAQIRGLSMATKNSNDAIALVQTAEGALQEVQNMLQRMNELAVQAASDTNSDNVDRPALQLEVDELIDEINDIARTTKFNDQILLDGTYKSEGYQFTDSHAVIAQEDGAAKHGPAAIYYNSTAISRALKAADSNYDPEATYTFKIAQGQDASSLKLQAVNGATTVDLGEIKLEDADIVNKSYTFAGGLATIVVGGHAGITNDAAKADAVATKIANALQNITPAKVEAAPLIVQVGAEASNTLEITIDSMDAVGLGIDKIDITSQENASAAIAVARAAIDLISTQRATLGAKQNRLEYKVNNLGTTTENLQAAESRIRDVDMAEEMSKFTQNNILTQAATAMLAQAQAIPQNVLQLLG